MFLSKNWKAMANISAAIKKEDLQLPSDQNQRLAFVLHNVLSPEVRHIIIYCHHIHTFQYCQLM